MHVNIHMLRCLKEELAWAIDNGFRLIVTMSFKTVVTQRN